MRTLQTSNRARNGLIGILIVFLVVLVGQSFASVPQVFATPDYYAEFTDAAGINPGDKVRVSGLDVGNVKSLAINGDRVNVGFTLGDHRIGTDSRLSIRTDTILGKRVIEIEPRGNKMLRADEVLPLTQSTTPYQLYDAFSDLTKSTSQWDLDTLKRSLNTLSETVDQTSPNLSAALDGIARFSDTLGKRDQQVRDLLSQANKVAGVLGNRSEQVNRLLVNAQVLLRAINQRGQAIDYLLANISELSQQFAGFVDDNPNLNNALEQLRTVSGLLVKRKNELAEALTLSGRIATQLNEAVASGPFFKVAISNIVPYWILQPFVDAAFKERGIDPEEFWRNAGLPAFRFPDPTKPGFSNGAPPPPMQILEGTPEFPGPAIPPGSPCSYTPAGGPGLPSASNPMPCAGATDGPYGPVPGAYGPPGLALSAPIPEGPINHGVPAAAIPGLPGPPVAGQPSPDLAPGPPGARTVPVPPGPPSPETIAPFESGGGN